MTGDLMQLNTFVFVLIMVFALINVMMANDRKVITRQCVLTAFASLGYYGVKYMIESGIVN